LAATQQPLRREVAELFWEYLHQSGIHVEIVTAADLQSAWAIGLAFPDQSFSIVDRTSFAVMQRLGIIRVASLDDDFAIYRYGSARDKAFEVVRSGHSPTFSLFHEAILNRQQVTCLYQGRYREVCPHVLGHKDGQERALVYQFGGESSGGFARQDWRCFDLCHVKEAEVRNGEWHSGAHHRKAQRCVDSVYIDVNVAVPDQPGRR
jgi:hypothetical protein